MKRNSINYSCRYLFCPRISGFIDDTEATLSLLMCCVTYLCQQHHSPDILDEGLNQNILCGAYGFHDFAANMWFTLVEKFNHSAPPSSLPRKLITILETLMNDRENTSWDCPKSRSSQLAFASIESTCPEVYKLLCRTAQFLQTISNSDFNRQKGIKIINNFLIFIKSF